MIFKIVSYFKLRPLIFWVQVCVKQSMVELQLTELMIISHLFEEFASLFTWSEKKIDIPKLSVNNNICFLEMIGNLSTFTSENKKYC